MQLASSLAVSLFLLAISLAAQPLEAQQNCQPPLPAAGSAEANIFTPQQEMDLGDAIAEHLQREFRVIDDEEITGYLQRVGDRVSRPLPPTNLRYQFFLFDLPLANAFGLPGGRIYVSRKLVAFARNEDELAGVLGHEIGHLVVHEAASRTTRLLRELLVVTQVTDRRDIFEKYNQLVENAARKPKAFQQSVKLEEREQHHADSIGLYAMANAGYAPQSYASFWDRFAETKGKTGGWLSDFFGVTKPESRRLREMLKAVAALPATCVEARTAAPVEEFQKWQAAVVNYSGLGHKEALHGVLAKKSLDPPLRGDINHLRFSPNGKYILAQDDASIYVISREPAAPLFRIDAPEAYPAQFTPDSQSVVFYNTGLRVEWWSIPDEQRTAVHEFVLQKRCLQTALSPDGKTLACFGSEYDLSLYDVVSGALVFQKKDFYIMPSFAEALLFYMAKLIGEGEIHVLHMGFSPDARFLVVGSRNQTSLAVDLSTRAPVPLPGGLKKLLSGGFAFVGPDRLVGAGLSKGETSALVRFPSGEVLERFALAGQHLASATHGDYVLVRPIQDYRVGVMDLHTKKIFVANKKAALDIYDQMFVSERRNGELGLYSSPGVQVQAVVTLPRGPLGHLRAAALSPDLDRLAVSELSRGAVWNLTKNERIFYLRGFRGAYFADDGSLYTDFPKYEDAERMISRLDLAHHRIDPGPKLEESNVKQYGGYVVVTKPAKKDAGPFRSVLLEVRDARSGAALWSREFPKEAPRVWVESHGGTILLSWSASAGATKDAIHSDSELSQRFATIKQEPSDYFLEALEARSGKVLGGLLVETGKGSFRISEATAAGDWVIVADWQNRILVYSLSTGKQKARIFGGHATLSIPGGLLCAENERGQLTLYDLVSLQKREQFVFSSPISLTEFSGDGKRLFVLTANQNAYWLDVSSLGRPAK